MRMRASRSWMLTVVSAGLLVAGCATPSQQPLSNGSAQGKPVNYVWTGMGINVPGSSKCPTYPMTINVTVVGDSVKSLFQQEGRPQRHFEATKDANGNFKTVAALSGGNVLQVSGRISDVDSTVLLDGYCKFGGTLTKK
jgi:hypothetical protein